MVTILRFPPTRVYAIYPYFLVKKLVNRSLTLYPYRLNPTITG